MLELEIIRESESPYASPIVIVKKKDGSNCICVDYRKLHKFALADPEPMTTTEGFFHGWEKFTPDGCYEFLRMPFGMKNSGATVVREIRQLLSDMDNVDNYIDDLIVCTKYWKSHLATLRELFNRLQEASFTARPKKCLFGSKTVDFLGHTINENWITINDENLEKIRNSQRFTTKKKVRSFLGLANYYRDHVPSCSAISASLSDLTKKGQPTLVRWGEAQEKASIALQEVLPRKPVLRLPDHKKHLAYLAN